MWSSRVVPQLMSAPVAVPISTTSRPFLASSGFRDVVQQWHMDTGMNSLSSLTRVIGCLVVITTAGLQLPNIFRVLKARSCEGVNVLSTAILLHSTSANVAYCINQNLPLGMWAESVPLMAQYIVLMCLLLLYKGGHPQHSQRRMLLFVLLYVLLMLPLLLGLVPGHMVCTLKALTLPLTLLGKVHELHTTYQRGGTGQKSKMSVFLLNLRSGGRLLTSIFDTCDWVLVLCYAHACFWNTLITCQTVYYAHKKRRRLREERKRRENEERAANLVRTASESSSSDSDNNESDSGRAVRFRRRRRCNAGFPLTARE